MTIKEMNTMIQAYCGSVTCENCIIRHECNECMGDFIAGKDMCIKAYETLYKKETEHDNVNHPKHYCRDGGMECIDEMLLIFGKSAVMAYCLLNSWKYRYRAADKNGEEDLKKSDWYIRKYKELKEESDNE